MPRPRRRTHQRSERGSAMIDVLVSVLLFSIGVLGLVRALAIAVRDAGEVEYRAVAATIADETLGRMWVDRMNLASYVETDGALPQLPGGTRSVTVDGSVVNVTIGWQPPGQVEARAHVVAATLVSN